MMGKIKRIRLILKSHYPQIVMWHCLNHRLELAVSDTITAVNGTQWFFDFLFFLPLHSNISMLILLSNI